MSNLQPASGSGSSLQKASASKNAVASTDCTAKDCKQPRYKDHKEFCDLHRCHGTTKLQTECKLPGKYDGFCHHHIRQRKDNQKTECVVQGCKQDAQASCTVCAEHRCVSDDGTVDGKCVFPRSLDHNGVMIDRCKKCAPNFYTYVWLNCSRWQGITRTTNPAFGVLSQQWLQAAQFEALLPDRLFSHVFSSFCDAIYYVGEGDKGEFHETPLKNAGQFQDWGCPHKPKCNRNRLCSHRQEIADKQTQACHKLASQLQASGGTLHIVARDNISKADGQLFEYAIHEALVTTRQSKTTKSSKATALPVRGADPSSDASSDAGSDAATEPVLSNVASARTLSGMGVAKKRGLTKSDVAQLGKEQLLQAFRALLQGDDLLVCRL